MRELRFGEQEQQDEGQLRSSVDVPLIDRVINDSVGKTYAFKADIFILDNKSDNKVNYDNCSVEFTNPVMVLNDGGKTIGSAVLEVSGHVVTADFFIDYSTPERLNIETKSIPIYPTLDSYTHIIVEDKVSKATTLMISSITIGYFPPMDGRIGSI